MAGVTAALVTRPLVTSGVVTGASVTGGVSSGGSILDLLQASNAWAIYPLMETSSPYQDIQGNGPDLTAVVANGAQFGGPGVLRGTTRGGGVWTNPNGNNEGAVRATTGPTAVGWTTGGFWFAMLVPRIGSGTTYHPITGRYQDTANDRWWVDITTGGGLQFRVQFGAHYVQANMSSIITPGLHTIGVVQRADGSGPVLYLDGLPLAATITTGGSGTFNSWFNDLYLADGASPVCNQFNIGRDAFNSGAQGVVSMFTTWVNSAPSAADMLAFHTEAVTKAPTDFCEFLLTEFLNADYAHLMIDNGSGATLVPAFTYGDSPWMQEVGGGFNSAVPSVVTAYNLMKADFGVFGGSLRKTFITKDTNIGPSTTNLTGTYVCVCVPQDASVAALNQWIVSFGTAEALQANATYTGWGIYCVGDGAGHVSFFLFIHDLANYEHFRLGSVGAYNINETYSIVITQDGATLAAWINGASVALTSTASGGAGITTEWIGDVVFNYPSSFEMYEGWAGATSGSQQDFEGSLIFSGFTANGDEWGLTEAQALHNAIGGVF